MNLSVFQTIKQKEFYEEISEFAQWKINHGLSRQIYTYSIYFFIYVNCFKIAFIIFFQCNAPLHYEFEEARITEFRFV
jgi:hypothetical protein